jgi:ATP-dependent Lon protease
MVFCGFSFHEKLTPSPQKSRAMSMSSEQQDGQSVPESSSSKAPENRNPISPEAHREAVDTGANREADAGGTPTSLAILPIRGIVLFPGMVVPLTIGRPSALKLVDSELPETKQLGLAAQRDEQVDHPGPSDVFSVGVSTQVLKLIRQPDGTAVLIVQALRRIAIESFIQTEPYLRASVRPLRTVIPAGDTTELEASFNNLRSSALRLLELSPDIPDQARAALVSLDQPEQLTDLMAGNLGIDLPTKQAILEEPDLLTRMRMVQEALQRQLEIAELQQKLRKDVEGRFSDTQRRVYLREQLRAIQRELGEEDADGEEQAEQLRKKLQDSGANETVLATAEKELKRLSHIPSASPEYSVIVSYVEMLADLPWNKTTEDNTDLARAQFVLDRDHYGLEKIKRRIVEFLAVRKLHPTGRSPILCFLGPPGVGKTSLGKSIAEALGRKFARLSLGGIRDEAEIRGHRRTYIGAMPGRIIQEIRRLGVRNPVLMLDEVDKIGADFRGDPASALLEVLDPRQNDSFVDRYLDVPFDLSQVIFIGTANYVEGIPSPLRDRMETIALPGYTETEKLNIAQKYLVPRQIEEHGLSSEQCRFDEDAIKTIIGEYTYEAGVRDLERKIASVCRSIAAEIARGVKAEVHVSPNLVRGILGASARNVAEQRLPQGLVGVVTGLAYTPMGGDVLFVEATKYPGKGGFLLTGQVGDVMRESMQAAYSLVRARARELEIDPAQFMENDVHIHVPSGAIPKDGPSAGVAMATAIASLFSNRPVRNDVAMTGEITLRGVVLPIGGLKEKSLAALRAGITEVLIPKGNEKDLEDIPAEAKERLHFNPVETIDEALAIALVK